MLSKKAASSEKKWPARKEGRNRKEDPEIPELGRIKGKTVSHIQMVPDKIEEGFE